MAIEQVMLRQDQCHEGWGVWGKEGFLEEGVPGLRLKGE